MLIFVTIFKSLTFHHHILVCLMLSFIVINVDMKWDILMDILTDRVTKGCVFKSCSRQLKT